MTRDSGRPMRPRTGAERYFLERLSDQEYADAYRAASWDIAQVDNAVRRFARALSRGVRKGSPPYDDAGA